MGLTAIGASLLGTGANALSNIITNGMNVRAQKEINATNIQNALQMQEKSRGYSLEDRDYNSEMSQYQRLMAIGMSPAMARASITGGITASQLGDINTSLPESSAAMRNPIDFSGLQAAPQFMFEQQQAALQREHEAKLQQEQLDFEREKQSEETIYEHYSRAEVREATPSVNDVWSDIQKEGADEGISFASKSREEIEQWLLSHNTALYDKLMKVSSNACANDLLNQRFERQQSQNNTSLQADAIAASTMLTEAQKDLANVSEDQIRQQMKYYPALCNVEIALKRAQAALTKEQMENIIQSTAFEKASMNDRLKMLGLQLNEQEIMNASQEFERAFREKHAETDRKVDMGVQIAGTCLQAIGTAVGIYTGLSSAGSLGRMAPLRTPVFNSPSPTVNYNYGIPSWDNYRNYQK